MLSLAPANAARLKRQSWLLPCCPSVRMTAGRINPTVSPVCGKRLGSRHPIQPAPAVPPFTGGGHPTPVRRLNHKTLPSSGATPCATRLPASPNPGPPTPGPVLACRRKTVPRNSSHLAQCLLGCAARLAA